MYMTTTNDNDLGMIAGLRLPLQLAPGEHVLSVRFSHTSVSTIDTEKLTFSTLEAEETLAEKHVEMPTFDFTPPSTGAFNTALDTTFAGDVAGLLLYGTTIPTTTSDTATIREVRLLIGGEIAYEGTFEDLHADAHYPADSTLRSITDNYLWLDFTRSPIAAGSRIELQIKSDDTNAIRIIPVILV